MIPATIPLMRTLRTIRRELRGFLHTPHEWLALSALTATLFLIELCLGTAFIGREFLSHIRTQSALTVELLRSASDQKKQELSTTLRTFPTVEDVQYLTQEQLYEATRESNPDLVNFLEKFKLENPFQDSLVITPRSLKGYHSIMGVLRQEQWRSVVDPSSFPRTVLQRGSHPPLLQLLLPFLPLHTALLLLSSSLLFFLLLQQLHEWMDKRKNEVATLLLLGAPLPLSFLAPTVSSSLALTMTGVASTILTWGFFFSTLSTSPENLSLPWRASLLTLTGILPLFLFLFLLCIPPLSMMSAWCTFYQPPRTSPPPCPPSLPQKPSSSRPTM